MTVPNDRRRTHVEEFARSCVERQAIPTTIDTASGPVRHDPASLDRPAIERRAIEVETRVDRHDLEHALRHLITAAQMSVGIDEDRQAPARIDVHQGIGGHVVAVQLVVTLDPEQAARLVALAKAAGRG